MPHQKATLWRRIAALVLDCVLVGVALQATAIALYPLTNGRVQADGFVHIGTCDFVAKPPVALPTPPGFQPNRFRECWKGLPFLPHSHFMHAETSTVNESAVKMDGWSFRVDRDGNVVTWPTLDILFFPLLFLWRGLLDGWSRQTLGRKALELKVVSGDGAAPGTGRALLRQLLVLWPLLLLLVFGVATEQLGGSWGGEAGRTSTADTALLALSAIWIVVSIAVIAWWREALYDRWTGTSVVIHSVAED